MPAIPTKANEVDRKLHEVVLACKKRHKTPSDVAEVLFSRRLEAFSYFENGIKQYKSVRSIIYYIGYARIIGLLDEDLTPTQNIQAIRSLENFQNWLSDLVLNYMNSKNASLIDLSAAMQALLSVPAPFTATYLDNIYGKIRTPKPTYRNFCVCLKIISLLRPNTLQIQSRRMLLIPDVLVDS